MSLANTIPVNEPLLGGHAEAYLLECLRSGWISSEGPFVRRFEEAMAAHLGRAHAVAVSNGSAALDAAVAALALEPGDEVILPAFTIISCAAAVVRAGAVPVLVDSDPLTWNMDVGQVESRITPRTRAVMPVHIYGLPVDMAPLQALAQRHRLVVIEDAAEALGLTCQGRPCGSLGDISTFSFYANKHVTTGEGGMLLTDDERLAAACRSLRNLCFKPEQRFVHDSLGWNLRMTSLQAALGLAQVEQLDTTTARKRAMGQLYEQWLEGVPGLQRPLVRTALADNTYWVYGVVLDDSVPFDARHAMAALARQGIGTRPFFWPMHQQPVFKRAGLFTGDHHPVAERLARRGFYLPSGVALTPAQIERSALALRALMGAPS
jgi:perosamine synthetase